LSAPHELVDHAPFVSHSTSRAAIHCQDSERLGDGDGDDDGMFVIVGFGR
jgi:hypothetical protein